MTPFRLRWLIGPMLCALLVSAASLKFKHDEMPAHVMSQYTFQLSSGIASDWQNHNRVGQTVSDFVCQKLEQPSSSCKCNGVRVQSASTSLAASSLRIDSNPPVSATITVTVSSPALTHAQKGNQAMSAGRSFSQHLLEALESTDQAFSHAVLLSVSPALDASPMAASVHPTRAPTKSSEYQTKTHSFLSHSTKTNFIVAVTVVSFCFVCFVFITMQARMYSMQRSYERTNFRHGMSHDMAPDQSKQRQHSWVEHKPDPPAATEPTPPAADSPGMRSQHKIGTIDE